MSQENVEIVRAAYRGWNQRGADGMLTFLHDDIEYLPAEEGPSASSMRATITCWCSRAKEDAARAAVRKSKHI